MGNKDKDPYLNQSRVEVEIMRHDYGSYDAHCLKECPVITASAPRDEQTFQHLHLVWLGHTILIAKSDGHDGDEEAKECLKLA